MKKIAFASLFILSFFHLTAQEKPVYQVHASLINNFIKYIQWPNEQEEREFVIGVLGDDNLYDIMKEWHHGKTRGTKKFVIKKLTGPQEASQCSIVYLGKAKSKEFDALKAAITGKAVLTITDGHNLGQKGSCLNFKQVGDKLKFELNQSAINAALLKVSSQLTNVAILL